jgi:hypothetical protein
MKPPGKVEPVLGRQTLYPTNYKVSCDPNSRPVS